MATASKQVKGPVAFKPYKLKKSEAYMNENQQDHFRNLLNLWRKQIQTERDMTVAQMKEEAMNRPDPLDRASLEEEYTLELRTQDRNRKFLKKIDEGLISLDEGNYGSCVDCGAKIGIRRLEARPTATQCIDCKTFDEMKEKQVGG